MGRGAWRGIDGMSVRNQTLFPSGCESPDRQGTRCACHDAPRKQGVAGHADFGGHVPANDEHALVCPMAWSAQDKAIPISTVSPAWKANSMAFPCGGMAFPFTWNAVKGRRQRSVSVCAAWDWSVARMLFPSQDIISSFAQV